MEGNIKERLFQEPQDTKEKNNRNSTVEEECVSHLLFCVKNHNSLYQSDGIQDKLRRI